MLTSEARSSDFMSPGGDERFPLVSLHTCSRKASTPPLQGYVHRSEDTCVSDGDAVGHPQSTGHAHVDLGLHNAGPAQVGEARMGRSREVQLFCWKLLQAESMSSIQGRIGTPRCRECSAAVPLFGNIKNVPACLAVEPSFLDLSCTCMSV